MLQVKPKGSDEVAQRLKNLCPEILCSNLNHENEQINFICMKIDCDQPSRLVCNYCNLYTHAHYNDFILLSDVFKLTVDKQFTQSYPKKNDPVFQEFYKYNYELIQTVSDEKVDEIINNIQEKFYEKIEQVRIKLKAKVKVFKERLAYNEQNLIQINEVFWKGYNLDNIQNNILEFKDDNDTQKLELGLNAFINDQERIKQIQLCQQKLKDYRLNLDIAFYDQTHKQCLQDILASINRLLETIKIDESVIVKQSQNWNLLMEYLNIPDSSLRLLFRASRDGFTGQDFHRKCDNKGPTLVIIKPQNSQHIFGGFTPCSWLSQEELTTDQEKQGFLYSLLDKIKYPIQKPQSAIEQKQGFGPIFGQGELRISQSFQYTYSQISYGPIYKFSVQIAQYNQFMIEELEVYQVIY